MSGRRPRPRVRLSPASVVVIIGVAGLLVAAAVALSRSSVRRTGTNGAGAPTLAVQLAAGQTLCEPGEPVAQGTAALRLAAGAPGPTGGRGPALAASVVEASGRVAAAGRLAGGWRPGAISVPLRPRLRTDVAASVCIRNLGPGHVGLGGTVPAGTYVAQLDGHYLDGRVRLEYTGGVRESWFDQLGTLAHRLTLGKSRLLRRWAPPVAVLLMLLAAGLALRTLLVAERRV